LRVHRFSATTASEAVVEADRTAIWKAITDPVVLPRLTPLLKRIDTYGDLWHWELSRVNVLGIVVNPTFTERMAFLEGTRIDYQHEPPDGVREWAGAEGWYELSDHPAGTHLAISLTLFVDLPLAGFAAPAVERVMRTAMAVTGSRFAANLEHYLGVRRS
jgi:carbon monoxide dehydrogenase subunit G